MSTWWVPNGPNGSLTVNGQIIPAPMTSSFYPPLASAPMYQGSGQPPPTVPLNYMPNAQSMNAAGAAAASNDPWNFFTSPVLIAIGALVVGYLGLRYVHWRG